jgi:hypothetical protein
MGYKNSLTTIRKFHFFFKHRNFIRFQKYRRSNASDATARCLDPIRSDMGYKNSLTIIRKFHFFFKRYRLMGAASRFQGRFTRQSGIAAIKLRCDLLEPHRNGG